MGKKAIVLIFLSVSALGSFLLLVTMAKIFSNNTIDSQGELYINGQKIPAVLSFVEENGSNYVEIPFLASLEALGYLVERENDTTAVWDIEGNIMVSDLSLYERGGFYNINSKQKSDEIFPAIGQDWGYRAVRDGDIYLDQLSLQTTLSELGIDARVIVDFPNKRIDIIG